MRIAMGATFILLSSLAVPGWAAAQVTGLAPAAPAIERTCSPAATPDELVVCGQRDEGERFRLPPERDGFDPSGTVMSVPLERHKLLDLGATGIGSCSTVGPAGWTGCDFRRWEEQRLQWAGERPGGGRRGVFVQVGPIQRR